MKISKEIPPIYQTLHDQFGVEWEKGLVITWGDTIHTKLGKLPPDLIAHESTHVYQQTNFEGGPDAWWKKYLADPSFRLREETAAYMIQVDFIKKNMVGRNARRQQFKHIVDSMVRMYGNMVTKEQAKEILKI